MICGSDTAAPTANGSVLLIGVRSVWTFATTLVKDRLSKYRSVVLPTGAGSPE